MKTTPKNDNALREQGEVGRAEEIQNHSTLLRQSGKDPLIGWHALATPLLKRQQKRQKRGRA